MVPRRDSIRDDVSEHWISIIVLCVQLIHERVRT